MSAKEKMQAIATNISDKTKEYAPIIKEKIIIAYHKTKDFTSNVMVPKIKEGADHIKEKIEDWQKNKAAKTTSKTDTVNTAPNTTTTNTTVPPTTTASATQPTQPTQPTQAHHNQTEHKKHQNHL
jgi:hypothetical protein